MTKNGRERRMMAREMKSGKVLSRRFFKACDYLDRKQSGKLREIVSRTIRKSGKSILFWEARKPRPSLIHKGGKL